MIVAINSFYSSKKLEATINSSLDRLDVLIEFVEGTIHYENACLEIENRQSDFFIHPLHLIPIERNNSFKIWSILNFRDSDNVLLIHKDFADLNARIPIPSQSMVYIQDHTIHESLAEIRPDLKFRTIEIDNLLTELEEGKIKYAVVEKMFLKEEMLNFYRHIILNSREFGHALGQGTFAIVGKSDDERGRIFRPIHDVDLATVCNIERKLGVLLKQKVNAHSEIDEAGNHHLWVLAKKDGNILKAHISQSTRFEIEQRALSQMNI